MELSRELNYTTVNAAFSKQATHYDEDDTANPILSLWRKRVYQHVQNFLKPDSAILELNAGTGIDAMHFASRGHQIFATDLSDGMITQIQQKVNSNSLQSNLKCEPCSFENLDQLSVGNFDYIFSNFGGLNCSDDLKKVTRHFPALLKPGAHLTLVLMPPVCPWEILTILKGNKKAFRRFKKNGTRAHLEGEHFNTYYYSVSDVQEALGKNFKLISSEGLGSLSPPPSGKDFPVRHHLLYGMMVRVEKALSQMLPFNRWADHIIVSFQFLGK